MDDLGRDGEIAPGTALLTGTGVVPGNDFSLERGEPVEIAMDPVGVLRNLVLLADDPMFRRGMVWAAGAGDS